MSAGAASEGFSKSSILDDLQNMWIVMCLRHGFTPIVLPGYADEEVARNVAGGFHAFMRQKYVEHPQADTGLISIENWEDGKVHGFITNEDGSVHPFSGGIVMAQTKFEHRKLAEIEAKMLATSKPE